ncbi:M4 family metallopeptidase [Bacillus thuringiensis]|uniref:M4 family metallopeptidase n=1 Tax=Bacillus thuringiensis TaxID=1428 RepID=UPI000E4BC35D|nr:M4 family metallopeptidase [Bacillus thuringiensis]MDZ3952372.1 M4 family metallopeptidase [Bacillus thuringiensis]RGP45202.1 bacillolysin [Bacillus thuringiensis]
MKNTKNKLKILLSASVIATSITLPSSSYAEVNNVLSTEKYNELVGSTEFISGQLTKPTSKKTENIIFDYINEQKGKYNIGSKDAENTFVIQKKEQDSTGSTVVRLQQVYNEIPVWESTQVAHINKDGILTVFSGTVVPELDKKLPRLDKKISLEDAISIAERDLGFKPKYEIEPTSQLTIYSQNDKAQYAYIVKLNFLDPQPGNYTYFIDVNTGEVVSKNNAIHDVTSNQFTNVTGSGKGVLGDSKKLNLSRLKDSTFNLQDFTRGNGIFTYDAKNQHKIPQDIWNTPNDKLDTDYDAAAVDAHYYSGLVYDVYKGYFNRDSFDNKGGAIRSVVHYGQNFNNAFWNGQQMIYGDGDGKRFIPLSGGIDVVGHEITHGVTQYSSELIYKNESGALDEAISDLFGTLIEHYAYKDPDYEIGEDIYTPDNPNDALRSMSDPTKYNQPDHYSKRYVGKADNGGVHINSGIINKAMYLLAEGGTHYGVSVPRISLYKTTQIYYRANTMYFTNNTTFSQARVAVIQAAADLYGQDSLEVKSVQKSFDAVGIE